MMHCCWTGALFLVPMCCIRGSLVALCMVGGRNRRASPSGAGVCFNGQLRFLSQIGQSAMMECSTTSH